MSDLALIGIPRAACPPDRAVLNLAVYDPATGERLPVAAADGSALGDSVRVGDFVLQAREDAEAVATFEGGLQLQAFEVTPLAVARNESVTLELRWAPGSATYKGVAVFVHLIAEQTGAKVAQSDGPPRLSDRRTLVLPADAAPGIYRPVIGLYRPDSGERLPLLDAVGQPLGDALTLCPVRVE